MMRFRCEGTDERGAAITRSVRARDRDRAVLLLLADGISPRSIVPETPSLLDRARRSGVDGIALLQGLAAGLAAGLPLDEAAQRLDGDAARRIADGAALGEVLAEAGEMPAWARTALCETAAEARAVELLPAVAGAAASIRRRRARLHGAAAEAAVLLGVATASLAASSWKGGVVALLAIVALSWALRRRGGLLAGLLARLDAADARVVTAVTTEEQAGLAAVLAGQQAEEAVDDLLAITRGVRLAATAAIGIVLVATVAR